MTPENFITSFTILKNCLSEVQNWMASSQFMREFIIFGSKAQNNKFACCFQVDILGSTVSPSDRVRNLGVVFDSNFKFSSQVTSVCRSCFVGIRDFRRIRRHLSRNAAIVVANALVSSKLDYCNALLRSLTTVDLNRLQCIQNTLARIVTRSSKFCHISPVLKSLHWLPVRYRIQFKTLTLIYKFLKNGTPKYFEPHLIQYSCAVNTRRSSPDQMYLHIPAYKPSVIKSKVHFQFSFSHDGPTLWNSLPHDIRSASSLSMFRRRLKTYLFRVAFPP